MINKLGKKKAPKKIKLKVLRPFWFEGVFVSALIKAEKVAKSKDKAPTAEDAGQVKYEDFIVEVFENFGRELIANGKAELYEGDKEAHGSLADDDSDLGD